MTEQGFIEKMEFLSGMMQLWWELDDYLDDEEEDHDIDKLSGVMYQHVYDYVKAFSEYNDLDTDKLIKAIKRRLLLPIPD